MEGEYVAKDKRKLREGGGGDVIKVYIYLYDVFKEQMNLKL